MKLLIDTDIGDDIDDALAFALAMDEGVELIGVTTVFGDTVKRARIVKRLLSLGGYGGVPVSPGYGQPLCGARVADAPRLYTSEYELDELSPTSKDPEDAVDFIIDSCKKYGKELTLLAIGPFTNIARAAMKDSEALSLCRTVIMGGAYFRQYADWNVCCDPEAARIMMDSIEGIVCIGADVTHRLRLSKEEDEAVLGYRGDCPVRTYIRDSFRLYKERTGGERTALHDPLALAYSLNGELCSLVPARVAVVTDGPARGLTLNLDEYSKAWMNPLYRDYSPKTQLVAKDADYGSMMARFLRLFK